MAPVSRAERRIVGRGTPEKAWQAARCLRAVPAIPFETWLPYGARLWIVAPHPDDEILGCGGVVALAARTGRVVRVVGVTDGEASHPGSAVYPAHTLGALRREESAEGLRRLGLQEPVHRPGLGDGHVAEQEARLAAWLEARLLPGDVVCTTWREDGHPDHEATGRAAAAAARAARARLREFPVWMWHWAVPDQSDLPWQSAVRIELPDEVSRAKAHALQAHHSQLVPDPSTGADAVLPPWVRERCLRSFEVYFT